MPSVEPCSLAARAVFGLRVQSRPTSNAVCSARADGRDKLAGEHEAYGDCRHGRATGRKRKMMQLPNCYCSGFCWSHAVLPALLPCCKCTSGQQFRFLHSAFTARCAHKVPAVVQWRRPVHLQVQKSQLGFTSAGYSLNQDQKLGAVDPRL